MSWLITDVVTTRVRGGRPVLIGVLLVNGNGKRNLRGLCTEKRLMYPSNPSLFTLRGFLVYISLVSFLQWAVYSSVEIVGPFPRAVPLAYFRISRRAFIVTSFWLSVFSL